MKLKHLDRLLFRIATIVAIICVIIGSEYQPAMAANIAAFGDSITEGIGSTTGGYPPKLEDLLNLNSNSTHIVDNHGKAGEPSAWGNGRIQSVLENNSYHYILILEGTNDIYFGLSLQSTQFFLEAMIKKARNEYGVTPLIALLLPDTRQSAPANRKNIETTYNPMITQIAQKLNVPLVDLHRAVVEDWESLSDDQLHPNDAGYQIVANTWFHPLNSLINAEDSGDGGDGDDDDGILGGCFIGTVLTDADNFARSFSGR